MPTASIRKVCTTWPSQSARVITVQPLLSAVVMTPMSLPALSRNMKLEIASIPQLISSNRGDPWNGQNHTLSHSYPCLSTTGNTRVCVKRVETGP